MSVRQASWDGGVSWPPVGLRLSQLWWGVRIGVWLCGLPIRWREHSLPDLLHHLTPTQRPGPRRGSLEMEQAVRIVQWLCRLRCFRGPRFPQACLRQALALYHVLSRLGYPVTIHIGVYKVGEVLRGHSWVTLDGQPVAERRPPDALQTIYTFPEAAARVSPARAGVGGHR